VSKERSDEELAAMLLRSRIDRAMLEMLSVDLANSRASAKAALETALLALGECRDADASSAAYSAALHIGEARGFVAAVLAAAGLDVQRLGQ
jgi:hypothetical protein